MNIPLTNPPHPKPAETSYGPKAAVKSGDSKSGNRNFYQRYRQRISRLDGKRLVISPAVIVMLSDEAHGLPHYHDNEFVIYDRHARPKKLRGYTRRTVIG